MDNPFPPTEIAVAYDAMARYTAWWVGDAAELGAVFHDPGQNSPIGRQFYADNNAAMRPYRHMFWSTPTSIGESNDKVHVPLAAQISSKSADLLFSRPPRVKFKNRTNQNFIDRLIDKGLFASFHEGAETCSALGGVYLYVCWDPSVSDQPWTAVADPERAIPEFKWGDLDAVTFWTIIAQEDQTVVRWLERHEPGFIRHNVFVGDLNDLGTLVPLTDYAATADLVSEGDDPYEAVIETGTDVLTAVYVPNMRPNKSWRPYPNLKDLGESDYANVEGMMDRLDQEWTEWVKEIRLGKTRLFIDRNQLQSEGKGQGAFFDIDRDLYVPINMGSPDEGKPIEAFQPDLRVDKFQATTDAMRDEVIQGAGYSVETFGSKGQATMMTATEVNAREKATITTRNMKAAYWTVGLKKILEALTAVAEANFELGVTQEVPEVEFPAYVSPQPDEQATGVSVLVGAGVMTVRTAVETLHPDWDADQVDAEVSELEKEAATAQAAAQPPVVPQVDATGLTSELGPTDLTKLLNGSGDVTA